MNKMVPTLATWLLSSVCLAGLVLGDDRGYQARACGFDMNRDGIVGSVGDCDVCDGTTTDPDGDGNPEDLIYVDCDAGSNAVSCGSPGTPCATISYAYNQIADGAGEEDIVCFRGTCTNEGTPGAGQYTALTGAAPKTSFDADAPACPAGTYLVSKNGNQKRDWCYPHDPVMIVGWDADDDGRYPPDDVDDVAVIDGEANGYYGLWDLRGAESYTEFAHFTVRRFGYDLGIDNSSRGFVKGLDEFNYFHDIEAVGVLEKSCQCGSCIVFAMSNDKWTAIENASFVEQGGWWMRGSGGNGPSEYGPIRVQNLTLSNRGMREESECGSGGGKTGAMKLWGYWTGVEFLDSTRVCDVDNWHGGVPATPCTGPNAAQCVQDFWAVNNEFIDQGGPVVIQGHASGACDNANARPVDEVVWDRNRFVIDRPNLRTCRGGTNDGATCTNPDDSQCPGGTCTSAYETSITLQISDFGNSANEYVEDLTITNNVFHWEPTEKLAAIYYGGMLSGGSPVAGTITIANNTFVGHAENAGTYQFSGVYGAILALQPFGSGKVHDNWVVKNNIFDDHNGGALSCSNVYVNSALATAVNWRSDHNRFSSNCNFHWSADTPSLVGWQAQLSADQQPENDLNSREDCVPLYVGAASDDYHLDTQDTCAKESGMNGSALTPWTTEHDIDGDFRSSGSPWDIGADEVLPPPPVTRPSAPTDLRELPD